MNTKKCVVKSFVCAYLFILYMLKISGNSWQSKGG